MLRVPATVLVVGAICVATSLAQAPARPSDARATAHTGQLRLESLTSRVFGNTRTLRILLPDEYDSPAQQGRRYPVLYLNDGQNLFDAASSTFNAMEWGVDETVATLTAQGLMRHAIVVGIDHAGRRERFHEYFPWPDEYLRPPDPDPQGRRYPDFLVDEVVPFVEARYRVDPDPTWRGIGGSSAGALAALYAVIARPGVFGRLLVESPSLYVNDTRVLREAAQLARWPARVVLGAGTAENAGGTCPAQQDQPELVRDVRRLADLITRAATTTQLRVSIVPCARHDEAAWAARLPDALAFLYGSASP